MQPWIPDSSPLRLGATFLLILQGWAFGSTTASISQRSPAAAGAHVDCFPPPELDRRAEIDIALRIQPLGDSITWGSLSSTGNGYRKPLQDLLLDPKGKAGVDVDFVGSRNHGNMVDNDNEGHSGAFLADILPATNLSIGAHPNVVLLHAGTNDMDKNRDVSTAIDRLEAIVRAAATGSPDAVILVAQIIFSTDTVMQRRTDVFNQEIVSMVEKLQQKPDNLRAYAVDMSTLLTDSDMSDRKHPNDKGYKKMAATWNDAIRNAHSKGHISALSKPSKTIGVGLDLDSTASAAAASTVGGGSVSTGNAKSSATSGSTQSLGQPSWAPDSLVGWYLLLVCNSTSRCCLNDLFSSVQGTTCTTIFVSLARSL